MQMSNLTRRRLGVALAAILATVATVVGTASPAAASFPFPIRPSEHCGASNFGAVHYRVDSTEVEPTLTQYMSIYITPGTTGERTETLTVINTVTTMLGASTSATAEWNVVFAKVSATVGFEVQRTTSSTSNETTTMRWTFSQPGYYGLYKGTRAVSGIVYRWVCDRLPNPITGSYSGYWVYLGQRSYTTFANMEAGTVSCGDAVPEGTLRHKARLQLGC